MKTPDEIKKALECCFQNSEQCADCPYYPTSCDRELVRDAREYIRQLEAENTRKHEKIIQLYNDLEGLRDIITAIVADSKATYKQLEAERDAAVKDIEESQPCFACKHFNRNSGNCGGGKRCLRLAEIAERNGGTYQGKFFEWRGVQKED